MLSNSCSSTATIQELSSGGSACTPLCSSSCSRNSTNSLMIAERYFSQNQSHFLSCLLASLCFGEIPFTQNYSLFHHQISFLSLPHRQSSLKHFAVCFLQSAERLKSNGGVKSDKKNEDADTTVPKNVINSNKASDYYIKSEELTSNLTQRQLTHGQEQ